MVAKSFGLPQYRYMESWMRSITVLRNCCAHHARTWNRRYPAMPQMPQRLPLNWVDVQYVRPMSQRCGRRGNKRPEFTQVQGCLGRRG